MRATLIAAVVVAVAGCEPRPAARPTPAPPTARTTSPTPAPAPPPAAAPPVTPWGEPATAGGLVVRVTDAGVYRPFVRERFGGYAHGETPYLHVRLAVANPDPARLPTYGPTAAVLRDTLGNTYSPAAFNGQLSWPNLGAAGVEWQLAGPAEVRTGEPVVDVVAFTRPAPAAADLTLEVRVGTGAAVFAVPADRWRPGK